MRELSTALCRDVARQVIALLPLQPWLDRRAVSLGIPMEFDDVPRPGIAKNNKNNGTNKTTNKNNGTNQPCCYGTADKQH